MDERTGVDSGSKRDRSWLYVLLICGCILLVPIVIILWLFLPFNTEPPSVSKYAGSEYYKAIQTINELSFKKPEYKNNYEKYFSEKSDYTDCTFVQYNNDHSYFFDSDDQMHTVVEADFIKKSDKHIFYMDSGTLKAFSIGGENSELVGSYCAADIGSDDRRYDEYEFLLSSDSNTITVITARGEGMNDRYTDLILLDVSDPANITYKKTVSLRGSYMTSRNINGAILILSMFSVDSNPDFADVKNYIPYIDNGKGIQYVSPDNICILPEREQESACFITAYMLEEGTLDTVDSYAFLGYLSDPVLSDIIHCTDTGIYIAAPCPEAKTEIVRVSYSEEGFEYDGSVSVKGNVLSQYSMDEDEDHMQVITANDIYSESENIYCIDLDTCQLTSLKDDASPAHANSFVEFTDDYLIRFSRSSGERYSDSKSVVEICKRTDREIVSVCKYEIKEYIPFNYYKNYKSFFIDRENRLIGFGSGIYYDEDHGNNEPTYPYILLHFDNNELHEVVYETLNDSIFYGRIVYADGYVYMLGHDEFKVAKVEMPE